MDMDIRAALAAQHRDAADTYDYAMFRAGWMAAGRYYRGADGVEFDDAIAAVAPSFEEFCAMRPTL